MKDLTRENCYHEQCALLTKVFSRVNDLAVTNLLTCVVAAAAGCSGVAENLRRLSSG